MAKCACPPCNYFADDGDRCYSCAWAFTRTGACPHCERCGRLLHGLTPAGLEHHERMHNDPDAAWRVAQATTRYQASASGFNAYHERDEQRPPSLEPEGLPSA